MKEVVGQSVRPYIFFAPFIGPIFGLMETLGVCPLIFPWPQLFGLLGQGTSLCNSASV